MMYFGVTVGANHEENSGIPGMMRKYSDDREDDKSEALLDILKLVGPS